ncbi:hypothetical protein M3Y96_01200200 [Aphelenchoides besseyi]|nr:hypothetical protein M3Y96_01200200 [Aphelenchoides besseyi]
MTTVNGIEYDSRIAFSNSADTSDISTESESAVDRPRPCSPFSSHYKLSQSEQIDELAEHFLEAHRAFDVFEFVPQSSFRLFYCLPKNSKVVAFKLTLTVAYRSNSGEVTATLGLMLSFSSSASRLRIQRTGTTKPSIELTTEILVRTNSDHLKS